MSRSGIFAGLAVVVLLVATASLAQAQNTWNWAASSGHWSVSGNWNPNGVPAAGDTATIDNNGTVIIDATDGTANLSILNMGDASGSGYLTMSGGALGGAGLQEVIGVVSGGSGVFTQSGGVNNTIARGPTRNLRGAWRVPGASESTTCRAAI